VTVAPPNEPYLSGFIPLDAPVGTIVEAPAVPVELPVPLPASAPEGLLWADLDA
jgi:hypothetical protein